jgi:hypothetical protein
LPSQLIQGIASRYALYELDAPARRAIKQLWPAIAPDLKQAVEAILKATASMPKIGAIVAQHRDFIKQLELSHLEALLNGELDDAYFESCQKTVGQEAALGFDARLRSTAGNYVLRAAPTRSRASTGIRRPSLPRAPSLFRRSSPSTSPTP